MSETPDFSWLDAAPVQTLLSLLNTDGEEARIVGGAVRNSLLGEPIKDIDIATTRLPADLHELLLAAGHKSVPTGLQHGTVTAIVDGQAFEVTTLRRDVETDGRHAQVAFGRDWVADAKRRDFTMNALYLDQEGQVHDPLGGMDDVLSRTVRFVDDPSNRIREDYLRILRFFRFFAWYGAFRPDAEGLKACVRLKDGLTRLSAERIWQELSRMLAAPDPSRAILWMRQTGVLTAVLPETEKWGIDALPGLVAAEKAFGWAPDAVLRLMTMLPPDAERLNELSNRLKLSNRVRQRLLDWESSALPDLKAGRRNFERQLYRGSVAGIADRLKLAIARHHADGQNKAARKYRKRLKQAKGWKRPVFPLGGKNLIASGMEPGPTMSEALNRLEQVWVDSDFELTREQLLARL